MNSRNQLICAWSGIAFVAVFTIGFCILANFLPPPSPRATADEIAAIYRQHALPIRFGMLLMMGCSGLIAPFVAVIAVQMKRMEGKASVLTYAQLSSGSVGILFFVLPALIWAVTAFRPDRDPQLTLLLSDMGWIFFLMPFTPFVVQNISIGFAVLGDKSERPVFPRWVGFFNFWVSVLFLPGGIITFFKSGPFAWNGLFGFWVPLVVFFVWYIVMFLFLRAGIKAQAQLSPE
jgi:hypothetical protein